MTLSVSLASPEAREKLTGEFGKELFSAEARDQIPHIPLIRVGIEAVEAPKLLKTLQTELKRVSLGSIAPIRFGNFELQGQRMVCRPDSPPVRSWTFCLVARRAADIVRKGRRVEEDVDLLGDAYNRWRKHGDPDFAYHDNLRLAVGFVNPLLLEGQTRFEFSANCQLVVGLSGEHGALKQILEEITF